MMSIPSSVVPGGTTAAKVPAVAEVPAVVDVPTARDTSTPGIAAAAGGSASSGSSALPGAMAGLLDGDRLRQVARLVDVCAAGHGRVVGEELERDDRQDGRQGFVG